MLSHCGVCVMMVRMTSHATLTPRIRAGMVGLGMIFDETYRPMFEQFHGESIYARDFGPVEVELTTVASRTGRRAEEYRRRAADRIGPFVSCVEPDAVAQLVRQPVDVVCIATPDDRHFAAA